MNVKFANKVKGSLNKKKKAKHFQYYNLTHINIGTCIVLFIIAIYTCILALHKFRPSEGRSTQSVSSLHTGWVHGSPLTKCIKISQLEATSEGQYSNSQSPYFQYNNYIHV